MLHEMGLSSAPALLEAVAVRETAARSAQLMAAGVREWDRCACEADQACTRFAAVRPYA
jgi:hypothetical protein